jgi:hypothetical protein
MARKKKFELGIAGELAVQGRLWGGDVLPDELNPVPPFSNSLADMSRLLDEYGDDYGVDYEFDTETRKPSIMGVASMEKQVGIFHDGNATRRLIEKCLRTGQKIVGHSVLGAERPILEKEWGSKLPLDLFEDSMNSHFLVNAALTKKKNGKEEDQDGGAMGFNDLWSATSLVATIPNWKQCRGLDCYGACPRHDALMYCSQDAWASLVIHKHNMKKMEDRGTPYAFYRKFMLLSEIALKMEENGLRIDREFVSRLDGIIAEKKEKLFQNPDGSYKWFNPNSSTQAVSWYQQNGINLESIQKAAVAKVLEKEAKKLGFTGDFKNILEELDERDSETLPENFRVIYNHYLYKSTGKGLDSWFANKYFGKDGLLHPRWIATGASSGRMASSRCNCQNVPSKGLMSEVRKAFIPLDPDHKMVKSDFSNMEFRMVAYQGGMDPTELGSDAFKWLIENTDGKFFEVEKSLNNGMGAKAIAKMVCHANSLMAGLKLLSGDDLEKSTVRRDINAGALRVYHPKYNPSVNKEWTYEGKVVAFTGTKLATELFKNETLESRRRALEIQEDVLNAKFPVVRRWQKKVLDEWQGKPWVRSLVGRTLDLYGKPEDNAKAILALFMQGVSADHVQEIVRNFYLTRGAIPLLIVHDEIVTSVPRNWTNAQVLEYMSFMGEATEILPGFKCPAKVGVGANWGEAGDEETNMIGRV